MTRPFNLALVAALAAAVALAACTTDQPLSTSAVPSKRPNILVIVADDLGVAHVGFRTVMPAR